jgi:hypothetical protein
MRSQTLEAQVAGKDLLLFVSFFTCEMTGAGQQGAFMLITLLIVAMIVEGSTLRTLFRSRMDSVMVRVHQLRPPPHLLPGSGEADHVDM